MALTAKRIARLHQRGRFGDGDGLYLQISKTGVKSWILRWEYNDGVKRREHTMGLGPLYMVDLKEARDRAAALRKKLKLDGVNPLAERREKAAAVAAALTFAEAAQRYFAFHKAKWTNAKHQAQFLSTLEAYALPTIGALPVDKIDTALVLKCIQPIWETKTETANRVRGRIEAVLNWATVNGYRSGDNPARWKGHLENALPARGQIAKTEHHAALPFAELPEFMAALRGREGIAARALELTILTAARTNEMTGARWSEVDFAAKLWTVPASRMKAKKVHRVPLSDRALAILKALPREGDYLFPGSRQNEPISNMAMDAVLRRMGYKDGRATVHGFRSSFRNWAAEASTGAYPNHVIEMALAHVIGNKVEAAYRRGDLLEKRRRLIAEWAAYASRPPATDATVVSIRGKR
jgi:integrase